MVDWLGVSELHQQHKKINSIKISAFSGEACVWLVLGANFLNCLHAKQFFQCVSKQRLKIHTFKILIEETTTNNLYVNDFLNTADN